MRSRSLREFTCIQAAKDVNVLKVSPKLISVTQKALLVSVFLSKPFVIH